VVVEPGVELVRDLPEDARTMEDGGRADLDGGRPGHQHLDRVDAVTHPAHTDDRHADGPRDVADAAQRERLERRAGQPAVAVAAAKERQTGVGIDGQHRPE